MERIYDSMREDRGNAAEFNPQIERLNQISLVVQEIDHLTGTVGERERWRMSREEFFRLRSQYRK